MHGDDGLNVRSITIFLGVLFVAYIGDLDFISGKQLFSGDTAVSVACSTCPRSTRPMIDSLNETFPIGEEKNGTH
jgi:hypothetical protein